MHFKTIKRDKILPMIEQAKDKKEQKSILCDLLECNKDELEALICELEKERAANNLSPTPDIKSGKWEDTEIEQLKKLHGRGLGSAEIAAKLGRPQKSVTYKLAELRKEEAQYELCEEAPDETPAADDKALIKKVAQDDELAAISAYANELQAKLKEKELEIATLQTALDASTAIEDQYSELIRDAEKKLEEKNTDLKLTEDRLRSARELLMKNDKKMTMISDALAKSLAFIASLNGVIADALKV
jgi:hypothetical protein